MHLLIPYAASHADGCQAALATLQLPNLQKLLSRLTAQPMETGDELSLSPPHERALARTLGLSALDGQIPWAALQAQKDPSLADFGGAWAFVTLCHWQADKQQVSMRQIPMQDLPQAESDTLLEAMRPFFAEDGVTLYPDEPGRWLAHADVFQGLATASPDRVLGRNLVTWMPDAAQASGLIRLISEMQMLLYNHPVNDAREARGALSINAIWLSGSGVLPGTQPDIGNAQVRTVQDQLAVMADRGSWSGVRHPMHPTVIPTLRDAALREDWSSWASAWQTLDATHIKGLLDAQTQGESVQLTLCGERHAQTWRTQPQALMQKIKHYFGTQPIQNMLKVL
jgi:hypothetical protein